MRTKTAVLVGICATLASIASTTSIVSATRPADPPDGGRDSSEDAGLTRARARDAFPTAAIEVRDATGTVALVGGSSAHPLQGSAGADPATAARRFVDAHGGLFGIHDAGDELTELREDQGAPGTGRAVRFQQTLDGVPVIAGQVAVQLDAAGAVVSSTGETSPGLAVDTNPTISSDDARGRAIAATVRDEHVDASTLTAADPELSIYDPQLIGATQDTLGPRLVWRVEPRSTLGEIDRLVLVDAHTGAIALDITQREDAKFRQVCDNHNLRGLSETCTSPVRTEGMGAVGPATDDVNLAYDYAGATYDFFFVNFGRDSLDGAGLPLKSTVRYCNLTATPPTTCTYDNAFWNGQQMVYGAGYPQADDVVAHELTHGLTQFTSNLFYYADAGAINESLSDVFGELIDQGTASPGDAAGDRWKVGESLPAYAPEGLRNMSDPPLHNDPDRVQSPLYRSGLTDNRGVHHNSGINNKAAYLMTDGNTFNGQTITGIGAIKVAWIYYYVETQMLIPGSDYMDLAAMLPQACTALIGGVAGIDAGNCQQVQKAVVATQMGELPQSTFVPAPPCDGGLTPNPQQFFDDMESNTANWAVTRTGGMGPWGYTTASASTGLRSAAVADAPGPAGTSTLTQVSPITVGSGATYLRFDHSYWTDGYETTPSSANEIYDGGFVEYSTDDGGTWHDVTEAGGTMINGYDGTIHVDSGTQPAYQNRPVFGHASPNYRTTRVDLSSLIGQSVRVRFVFVNDNYPALDYPGWFVDNVAEYSCLSAPSAPRSVVATSADGAVDLTWIAPVNDGGTPLQGYDITPFVNGVAQPTVTAGADATSIRVPGLTNGTTYTFQIAARNAVGLGAAAQSNPAGAYAAFRPMPPARLLDSRPGGVTIDGLFSGLGVRPAGSVTQLDVAGRAGVAPDAAAVVLNVTVTEAAAPGYVTLYPCGGAPPTASNLNYVAGSTIPNLVVSKIGTNGQVCIFTQSDVQLVADVSGWFPAASSLTSLVPARLLDTRDGAVTIDGLGAGGGKPGAGSVTRVKVADRAGIPAGAGAAVLNVTVTGAEGPGYATVYPCGAEPPTASNLNYTAGQTIPNAVVAKIGTNGEVCIFSQLATHLVVDVNGWFPAFSMPVPLVPARLLDTRPTGTTVDGQSVGGGEPGAGAVTSVQVAGRGGVPATASAAVLNVTVTESTAPGYATVYPCGTEPPTASNLNYGFATTIPNAVITKIGADGRVCIYTQQATHVLVDVNAYFTG